MMPLLRLVSYLSETFLLACRRVLPRAEKHNISVCFFPGAKLERKAAL